MKVTPSKFKPFFLITKEDNKKVIIVAGNTQASPIEFTSEQEAEKYLKEQPYEMFTNLYTIFKYYEKNGIEEESKQVVEKHA